MESNKDENIRCFQCSNIGVTMDENIRLEEKTNIDGSKYWCAKQDIGTLFGSKVHGECSGIGRTKEQALERLKEDIKKLGESLWY